MRLWWGAAAVAALALAGALVPAAPVYDAWSWLVWGREVTESTLDTSAGPSWKPLTVLLAAPVSLAGESADEIWLLISRAGWLAVPFAAAALAGSLAGRAGERDGSRFAGAVIAALGAIALMDVETAWVRQGLGGLSEPAVAALLAFGVTRLIDGTHVQAVVVAFLIGLLRPEIWPLAAIYGVWLWRRGERRAARVAVGLAPLLAAAWFVPDLVGASNPIEGPARARSGELFDFAELAEALGGAAILAPLSLTALAVLHVRHCLRTGETGALVTAGVAVGWLAVVAGLTLIGFAGLARFSAPAAVLLCALGAAGAPAAWRAARGRLSGRLGGPWLRLGATLLVLAAAADLGWRAAALPDAFSRMAAFERETTELERLMRVVRSPACAPITTNALLFDPAVAWLEHRPLVDVGSAGAANGGLVLVHAEHAVNARTHSALGGARPIAAEGGWEALSLPCRTHEPATNP